MGIPILGGIIEKGLGLIDKFIPDKEQREKFKHEFTMSVLSYEARISELQAGVITSEATGESFLQRNWRPMVMLFLTGLVGAHWLGFTAPNITEQIVADMLDIVKIGLGGYVVGRSVEKTARNVAPAMRDWANRKAG